MPISAWIILILIIAVVFWGVVIYNRLVAMRQQCSQAFADVDVQLKRRHDLVPNLVETVRAYAGHERGTLEAVVQARNAAASAQGIAAQATAENMLSGALRQLFALSEAYPNLKASDNFLQLQSDLADIENRLAAARRAYNAMIQGNNTMVQQFPTVVLARAFGFGAHEFFNVNDEREALDQRPQIKFQ
jgi:LemA protein